MSFEHYIFSDGKRLRCGYTTGTCAALAAAAAAARLINGQWPEFVSVLTPKGLDVEVVPENLSCSGGMASCSVIKDGGDDIDATHGMEVFASVSLKDEPGIFIDGGEGVGRVTKPGLNQPVGNAAINSVPRQMISESVQKVLSEGGYTGGANVIISVPDGEKIAQKTFNPNLGIANGISILGTSGIVVPMSLQALSESMKIELRQQRALGSKRVILVPGNYGTDFLKSSGINFDKIPLVRISNFFGDALDECASLGFEEVLIVSHIGKGIKLAGGIMNTHSRFADCRTELFCAHAAVCGAPAELCRELLNCATTDACIDVLKNTQYYDDVIKSLISACNKHLGRRIAGQFRFGLILFSNIYGLLGETTGAKEILSLWQKENSME